MGLNFKEALAILSRALLLVLFRAGVFVAGGFMVIVLFAMVLIASRLAGGANRTAVIVFASLAALGWWAGGRVMQRFFLYRQQASMLLAFSGGAGAAGGMAAASEESKRLIPDHPRWKTLSRSLRRALLAFNRGGGVEFPAAPVVQSTVGFARILDQLGIDSLGQAIVALAYARGGTAGGNPLRESLALYFVHGTESRRLARKWLLFSAYGQLFLFLCLAVPNWFFFRSAGAPVWIGVVLAAAIARLLHQAFIVPFVLAGLSASLLAETKGHEPDAALCEKITPLLTL